MNIESIEAPEQSNQEKTFLVYYRYRTAFCQRKYFKDNFPEYMSKYIVLPLIHPQCIPLTVLSWPLVSDGCPSSFL